MLWAQPSWLSSNIATRTCGESRLPSAFCRKAVKLKCHPSTVKHLCLGFGCSYFSGFHLWEGCSRVCTLLTISTPNHSFLLQKTSVIINHCRGFKVLKKCYSEEELMKFLLLRAFGEALVLDVISDWYPSWICITCHCSLYYSKPFCILKPSILEVGTVFYVSRLLFSTLGMQWILKC